MTGPELTAQFQQPIPWDRGMLQPVTTRIEYEKDARVPGQPVNEGRPTARDRQ